jgi:hypothetical protein
MLGSADFRPKGSATYQWDGGGYIHATGGGDGIFVAPVHLPNGAVLDEICVWYYNSTAVEIHAEWVAYGLGFGNIAPFFHLFQAFDLPPAGAMGGYDVQCVDAGTVIHAYADLDGDTIFERPVYAINIYLSNVNSEQQIGGALLVWHYQVSPAPGAPTFLDVPPSDFGFQYIEALVDAGITGGTGGGNYSPDAFVTRRQMAIFLAKALGLYWPN